MKLNRKNKKGFTIVELVIVIAVIGILAAILIPTFTNLTKNAQDTAAKQTVSDAYVAYFAEVAGDNECTYSNLYHKDGENYVKDEKDTVLPMKNSGGQLKTVIRYQTNQYFTYTQEKGWEKTSDTLPAGATLVLDADDLPEQTKYVRNSDGTTYTQFSAEIGSTFNSCVIYWLA